MYGGRPLSLLLRLFASGSKTPGQIRLKYVVSPHRDVIVDIPRLSSECEDSMAIFSFHVSSCLRRSSIKFITENRLSWGRLSSEKNRHHHIPKPKIERKLTQRKTWLNDKIPVIKNYRGTEQARGRASPIDQAKLKKQRIRLDHFISRFLNFQMMQISPNLSSIVDPPAIGVSPPKFSAR